MQYAVKKKGYLVGWKGQEGHDWTLYFEKAKELEEGLEEWEGTFYQTGERYNDGWFQDLDSGSWIRVIGGKSSGLWMDEPEE